MKVIVNYPENKKTFNVNSKENIKEVCWFVTGLYSPKDQVKVYDGIQELLINAVEHGTFKIGYDKKTELKSQGFSFYDKYIIDRLVEYTKSLISIDYEETEEEIKLTITDQGDGFDWKSQMKNNRITEKSNHGLGLVVAKQGSFDKMYYNNKGNAAIGIIVKS